MPFSTADLLGGFNYGTKVVASSRLEQLAASTAWARVSRRSQCTSRGAPQWRLRGPVGPSGAGRALFPRHGLPAFFPRDCWPSRKETGAKARSRRPWDGPSEPPNLVPTCRHCRGRRTTPRRDRRAASGCNVVVGDVVGGARRRRAGPVVARCGRIPSTPSSLPPHCPAPPPPPPG